MRPSVLVLHRALAPLLLLVAGACTQAIATPPAPLPVAIARAPSSALAPSDTAEAALAPSVAVPIPAPPSAAPLGAWTDTAALAELAKSCAWAPADPRPDEPGALSCQVHFEQTCNPIGCDIEYQARCLPACKASCQGCLEACRATCSTCAVPCTGAGCRAACAETTGACLQACLEEEDHCASGTCGQALATCSAAYQAAFEKSNCERLRPKYMACIHSCVEHPSKEILRESSDYLQGVACQDRCVSSVLGSKCSAFSANFRVF